MTNSFYKGSQNFCLSSLLQLCYPFAWRLDLGLHSLGPWIFPPLLGTESSSIKQVSLEHKVECTEAKKEAKDGRIQVRSRCPYTVLPDLYLILGFSESSNS